MLLPDIKEVVRLVDDFQDQDYKTRDSCPGKVFGHQLTQIGLQRERRFFGKGKVKHIIFVEEGTRNIWYKDSFCSAGIVAMGFSLSKLEFHPKAVPMETYAEIFLDGEDRLVIPVGTSAKEWMKRNNFELYAYKF